MPFNGSGTFVPLSAPNYPAVAGTLITASASNANLADIFSGLTNCITRNGQSPATANIPMAGYKLTGLGAATGAGDATRYEQTLLTSGINPLTGSLTFSGTGLRILGDLSNATIANRLAFQSSTTNGATLLATLPNGTSNISGFVANNAADPTNASIASLTTTSADIRLASSINGAGSYLPLTFYTGGSERARITTTGEVLIGATSTTTAEKTQLLSLARVTNLKAYLAGSSTANITLDTNSYAAGGWASGREILTGGSVTLGAGIYGTNTAITRWAVGLGATWYTTPALAVAAATGNVLVNTAVDNTNYKFQVNGAILAAASTTSIASMNIPPGTAPTSPVNGDLWTETAGVNARVNGNTRLLLHANSPGVFAGKYTGVVPAVNAGASATFNITATGITTSSPRVTVTPTGSGWQARPGLVITAYVSAADTITVTLFNPTAGNYTTFGSGAAAELNYYAF